MIAFLVLSSVITPPAIWLLVLCNLDYKTNGCETLGEDQGQFLRKLIKSGQFWAWAVWCFLLYMIFSGNATAILKAMR